MERILLIYIPIFNYRWFDIIIVNNLLKYFITTILIVMYSALLTVLLYVVKIHDILLVVLQSVLLH